LGDWRGIGPVQKPAAIPHKDFLLMDLHRPTRSNFGKEEDPVEEGLRDWKFGVISQVLIEFQK